MPELPEVETMRRGIESIVGSRLRGVARTACRRKPILVRPDLPRFRRRTEGREILAVRRMGKRVVVDLEGGDAIVIEPRMTGLVLVADPPDVNYLRVRFELEGSGPEALLFWDRRGLGVVELLSPAQFSKRFALNRLGPDSLAVTPDVLRERLGTSRRAIKVALMDQRALAGIGNLYASEILHAARISPLRRCDRLKLPEWAALASACVDVLTAAIRYEGSTLGDGTYRNALNQAGGYQHQHRVYSRAGKPCLTCDKGTVLRLVQAQRSTFFCPVCQPASPQRVGPRRSPSAVAK
ncbi:MAG: bifunctional DNA-formamidopyrimidine glycosylase/DNA-(apurinic or apyrimidinic site) lyase [Pirellulales bacterium]